MSENVIVIASDGAPLAPNAVEADLSTLSLIPVEADISPDDALAAAAVDAQESDDAAFTSSPPRPMGRSWALDWKSGQFVRQGAAPAATHHLDTLKQWVLATMHTARFAHVIFSDNYGWEGRDVMLGQVPSAGAFAEAQSTLISALMVHDRITAVDEFSFAMDDSGEYAVIRFSIHVDDEETLPIEASLT